MTIIDRPIGVLVLGILLLSGCGSNPGRSAAGCCRWQRHRRRDPGDDVLENAAVGPASGAAAGLAAGFVASLF